MSEIKEKITTGTSGKYLSLILEYGPWEFREEVPVNDDYKIDKNKEPYQLCKTRLIANIKRKIPNYVE